jgi:hypothetical protein
MSNTYNVVALNPRLATIQTCAPKPIYHAPQIRMTAAFRALIDAPESPVERAFLRLALTDATNGVLAGFVTWSIDEICRIIVIRQWPTSRVLDLVPFPVEKLSARSRALRLAARIGVETATIGIADDPDSAMVDETGQRVGSRIGVFP